MSHRGAECLSVLLLDLLREAERHTRLGEVVAHPAIVSSAIVSRTIVSKCTPPAGRSSSLGYSYYFSTTSLLLLYDSLLPSLLLSTTLYYSLLLQTATTHLGDIAHPSDAVVLTLLACCDATQYLVRVRVRAGVGVRTRVRARVSDAIQHRANAHAEEPD